MSALNSVRQSRETAEFSRRDFITRAGSGLLLGAFSAATGCSSLSVSRSSQPALVGSQLYGWGQYYEQAGKKMSEHMDEILSAIRDCGYDYAESSLDLNQPENNTRFAERCRNKGLRPVSLYTGARLHDDKAEQTVRRIFDAAKMCRAEGYTVINCNPDSIGREKTDQELSAQVAALRQLGSDLNELGLRLGIHNDMPEMRNRAREFHYNFENTEPGLVGLCDDVDWVFRGGLRPMEVLRQYGDRIVSWHLRQSRNGIWWEDLDKGDIDYDAVARYAREHGLTPRYTVELAIENGTRITRSVVENHQRSREFVRKVFGT